MISFHGLVVQILPVSCSAKEVVPVAVRKSVPVAPSNFPVPPVTRFTSAASPLAVSNAVMKRNLNVPSDVVIVRSPEIEIVDAGSRPGNPIDGAVPRIVASEILGFPLNQWRV
jgi:hypothetical protein